MLFFVDFGKSYLLAIGGLALVLLFSQNLGSIVAKPRLFLPSGEMLRNLVTSAVLLYSLVGSIFLTIGTLQLKTLPRLT